MIRAVARDLGAADVDELGTLWRVRAAADQAVTDAIDRLHAKGYSWAEMAGQTGVSRQSLYEWRQRRPGQPGVRETMTRDGAP
jgi:transposase-like protein